MHRAGVELFVFLLLLVIVGTRAIGGNRPYLCGEGEQSDSDGHDYLHFGSSVVAAVPAAIQGTGQSTAGETPAATADMRDSNRASLETAERARAGSDTSQ